MVAARRVVVGSIDGESRGRLHGWAFCRPHPLHRLTVDISTAAGGHLSVLADRYRADVQQRGLSDGYCGFSVPVSRLDTGPLRLAVREPSFELGVVTLAEGRAAKKAADATFIYASHTLQIDSPVGRTQVTGWAMAVDGRHARRVLRMRSGPTILAQQRATLYRPELAVGGCDGYHGFSFPLPAGSRRSLALEDVESGLLSILPS